MVHVPLLQQLWQAEFSHTPVDPAVMLLLVFWLQVAAKDSQHHIKMLKLQTNVSKVAHTTAAYKILDTFIFKICSFYASAKQYILQQSQNYQANQQPRAMYSAN